MILQVIRGYVKFLFACRECGKSFETEAKSIWSQVRQRHDAILWLWETHNKISERLQNDPNNDPLQAKVQFPLTSQCMSCKLHLQNGTDTWMKPSVATFIINYYRIENIVAKTYPVIIDNIKSAPGEGEMDAEVLGDGREKDDILGDLGYGQDLLASAMSDVDDLDKKEGRGLGFEQFDAKLHRTDVRMHDLRDILKSLRKRKRVKSKPGERRQILGNMVEASGKNIGLVDDIDTNLHGRQIGDRRLQRKGKDTSYILIQ